MQIVKVKTMTREEAATRGYTKICGRVGCPIAQIPQRTGMTKCGGCREYFPGDEPEAHVLKKFERKPPPEPTHTIDIATESPRKRSDETCDEVTFGRRVNYYRTAQRISMEVMLQRLDGLDESMILEVEEGRLITGDYVRQRFADAVGVPLHELEKK